MSTAVAKNLDYAVTTVSTSSITHMKLAPQSTLTTVSSSGGQEMIWELPPKVMNLGKSILSFTLTPDSTGSLTAGTQWANISTVPFSSIQLYSQSGVYLADISSAGNFIKMVNQYETPLSELQNSEVIRYNSGFFNGGVHKSNVLAASTPTESLGYRPTESEHKPETAYTEPQYLISSSDGSTAPTTDTGAFPVLKFQMELSKIKHSCFVDLDTYMGQTLLLRFVWNKSSDLLFVVDDASSDDDPVAAAPSAYAGDLTLSNLYLYLAVESDESVIQAVLNKYNSGGLSYPIDWVYSKKTYLGAATNHNLDIRISPSQGSHVKSIWLAPFHATEGVNTKWDHSVVVKAKTGTKVTSLYSTINSVRTTQYDWNLVAGDSWLAQKDMFKGSCIQSSNQHLYNYCHIENFMNLPLAEDTSKVVGGFPMHTEMIYALNTTTPGSDPVNWYAFIVMQRRLVASPAGLQVI